MESLHTAPLTGHNILNFVIYVIIHKLPAILMHSAIF